MVVLAGTPVSMAVPRRYSRVKLIVLLSVALLVVAGGAVAATAVSFRYLHAAPLSTSGGGWRGEGHIRTVRAGGVSASVVAPRPGHTQVFELDLNNFSDVTQTVIGLTDARELADRQEKAEPERLLVSSTATFPRHGRVHYTSKPVTIPPGGQYRLRFLHDTSRSVWGSGSGCRSTWWDDLSLQVKVGWFTRTETLDLGSLIMEIRQPGKGC